MTTTLIVACFVLIVACFALAAAWLILAAELVRARTHPARAAQRERRHRMHLNRYRAQIAELTNRWAWASGAVVNDPYHGRLDADGDAHQPAGGVGLLPQRVPTVPVVPGPEPVVTDAQIDLLIAEIDAWADRDGACRACWGSTHGTHGCADPRCQCECRTGNELFTVDDDGGETLPC